MSLVQKLMLFSLPLVIFIGVGFGVIYVSEIMPVSIQVPKANDLFHYLLFILTIQTFTVVSWDYSSGLFKAGKVASSGNGWSMLI